MATQRNSQVSSGASSAPSAPSAPQVTPFPQEKLLADVLAAFARARQTMHDRKAAIADLLLTLRRKYDDNAAYLGECCGLLTSFKSFCAAYNLDIKVVRPLVVRYCAICCGAISRDGSGTYFYAPKKRPFVFKKDGYFANPDFDEEDFSSVILPDLSASDVVDARDLKDKVEYFSHVDEIRIIKLLAKRSLADDVAFPDLWDTLLKAARNKHYIKV